MKIKSFEKQGQAVLLLDPSKRGKKSLLGKTHYLFLFNGWLVCSVGRFAMKEFSLRSNNPNLLGSLILQFKKA